MSKLLDEFTRERLEYYANLPTQPFGDDASVFMYEVRKLARIALEEKHSPAVKLPPSWPEKMGAYGDVEVFSVSDVKRQLSEANVRWEDGQ